MNSKNILIAGGSGFLGRALVADWVEQGHRVTVLSRNPVAATSLLGGMVTVAGQLDALDTSNRFDAVVNLAGAPIFGKRWSDAQKLQIRESRIAYTKNLINFIASQKTAPEVLISASAVGFYGSQGDKVLTEGCLGVEEFSHCLCKDWENSALQAEGLGVRVCLIRTGLVLDKHGGLLQRMLPAFRVGLGGRLGGGTQWMSWIHLRDWLAIVDYLLNESNLAGAFNVTAPNPVTNKEFSRILAGVLHRPMFGNLPAELLKMLLGEMSELLLGSQRVVPERLLKAGFQFRYDNLESALTQIIHS